MTKDQVVLELSSEEETSEPQSLGCYCCPGTRMFLKPTGLPEANRFCCNKKIFLGTFLKTNDLLENIIFFRYPAGC